MNQSRLKCPFTLSFNSNGALPIVRAVRSRVAKEEAPTKLALFLVYALLHYYGTFHLPNGATPIIRHVYLSEGVDYNYSHHLVTYIPCALIIITM
jgi:hypothetical protein